MNPATVTVNNTAGAYTFSGNGSLVGMTSLTKNGPGTLTIANANSHSGGTVVNGGVLILADSHAVGTGSVTVNAGCRLDLNGVSQAGNSNTFIIAGTGLSGEGALVNNSGAAIQGAAGVPNLTLSGDATIGGTSRWDVAPNAIANGGSFTLTKTGANDIGWQPSMSATLGDIVIAGGRFLVSGTNNLGSDSSSIILPTGGTLSSFGTANETKPVIMDGGLLTNDSGTSTWAGGVTLQLPGTNNEISTPHGTIVISGKITGPGGLLKTGGGALEIQNASNDYAGDTLVSAGILEVDQLGTLPATTAVTVTGDLRIDTNNVKARSISGTGLIDGGGTLTISPSSDLAFSGTLREITVVKAGSGTLTIAGGISNFVDSIEVAGGTLVLAKTGTGDSSGIVAIAGDQGLKIDPGAVARLSGTGDDQIDKTVDVVANGTFDYNGHNEAFHALTGSGTVLNSLPSSSSTITLGEGDRSGAVPATFSGSISDGNGTLGLIKRGALTQSLNGINTYSRSTTIADGTLAVNGSLTNSLITVANDGADTSSATLAGTGTVGPVTLGAGLAIIAPGPTGAHGSVGTLSMARLTTQVGNPTLQYDLRSITTAGNGVNDLITVAGDLNLNAATALVINPVDGTLSSGTYTLLTTGGTVNGIGNLQSLHCLLTHSADPHAG